MFAAFEGRMFKGRLVGCLGWMFSFAGRGLLICCMVPCVAMVANEILCNHRKNVNYCFLTVLLRLNGGCLRTLLYEHSRGSIGLGASNENGVWREEGLRRKTVRCPYLWDAIWSKLPWGCELHRLATRLENKNANQ